jgi:hypothetical protein
MSRSYLRIAIISRDYGHVQELLEAAKNHPVPGKLERLFAEAEKLDPIDQLWFKNRFSLVKIGDRLDYA